MSSVDKRGKFLVMSGIAGAGKSELTKWVKGAWPEDRRLVTSREPGGTRVGEAMRDAVQSPKIKEERHPIASLFGYSGSRAQLIYTIGIPTLEAGIDFWLDRYWESTWSYQGQELPKALVYLASMVATRGLLPDKWMYLTGNVETFLRRKELQKHGPGKDDDIWDVQPGKIEFARKADRECKKLGLLYPRRWRIIDANGSFGYKAQQVAKVLASEGIFLRDVPDVNYDLTN